MPCRCLALSWPSPWSCCRRLELSLPATVLALLATAFFPLNQATYELGNFHHHFAEHLFVLASLVCGVGWLQQPDSVRRAVTTGLILGISVGVHTTQFILQFPQAQEAPPAVWSAH